MTDLRESIFGFSFLVTTGIVLATVACSSNSSSSGLPTCSPTEACVFSETPGTNSDNFVCRQTCSGTDVGDAGQAECPSGTVCREVSGCCSGTECSAESFYVCARLP